MICHVTPRDDATALANLAQCTWRMILLHLRSADGPKVRLLHVGGDVRKHRPSTL